MNRNSQIKGFKPLLIRESMNTESSDVQKHVDTSKSSTCAPVRSTSKILKLFKKTYDNSIDNVSTNDDPIEPSDNRDNDVKENCSSTTVTNDKIIFNVVIGKQSTRKHKKWDDDGTLEVEKDCAVLKDSDGNVIHRTKIKPDNLVEGSRMHIGNKEIEIIDKVLSAKRLSISTSNKSVDEPPLKKLKTTNTTMSTPFRSLSKGLALTYNPLVMPCLSAIREWAEQNDTEKEQEVSVDPGLANELRPHQRYGVVFLYECIMGMKVSDYFGTILADEMGLGKTLQCITIIWTLLKKGPYGKPILKHVLIVAPSSLCSNWKKEFIRWLGSHKISPYVVNAKNKAKDFKNHPNNCVMIISYDMVVRYQEEIEQITFDLIACDEGHKLKNNDIKAAKFLRSINCKRKILLTGTPLQNDLQEFFSLVDFVNPGILGTNNDYKQYYENPIVASRCPNAADSIVGLGTERARELYERTKCFILRRTQDTINKYLPSKHEIIVFCRLSDEQEYLYTLVTNAWFEKFEISTNDISPLKVIVALKKICNHPELFDSDKNDFLPDNSINSSKISYTKNGRNSFLAKASRYCGKMTIVHTLMKNLKETDEKLVLISYYTQTLNLFQTICDTENIKFLRLDGRTPTNLRLKIVEQFNTKADSSKVFLLSAKAGGVGLNLPGASRLVLFDSDWNPASDAQAMARIWREGQKKPVYIYRLLTTGTIEEKIFQRQISKSGLSDTVVNLNDIASFKLSNTELKDLFTLATDTDCLTHDLMKCSCNGRKRDEKVREASNVNDTREYHLVLKGTSSQQNLTINQLSEWEHYKQPIPDNITQEMMLLEVCSEITFAFKNSTLR